MTYARPVKRRVSLLVVVPNFVKVILVQLPYEAGEVAVLEVLW